MDVQMDVRTDLNHRKALLLKIITINHTTLNLFDDQLNLK